MGAVPFSSHFPLRVVTCNDSTDHRDSACSAEALVANGTLLPIAVSPKPTHLYTRSYDIISAFILKAFTHLMGLGKIIENFHVKCLRDFSSVAYIVQIIIVANKNVSRKCVR